MLMLTFIFLAGILLGSVPFAESLDPTADGVPVDFLGDVVDGSNLDPDEPDEDEEEKFSLRVTASAGLVKKLAWTRKNEAFDGAFFSSIRFALPPVNAPPSAKA